MIESDLKCFQSAILVQAQTVDRFDDFGQGLARSKTHRDEATAATFERELQVALADNALGFHAKLAVEARLWKALAPHLILDHAREIDGHVGGIQVSVDLDALLQVRRAQALARHRFERGAEILERIALQRDARGAGMSAEALEKSRAPLVDEIEFPLASRAKANTGRWKRSLRREARMPTTPACQSAR